MAFAITDVGAWSFTSGATDSQLRWLPALSYLLGQAARAARQRRPKVWLPQPVWWCRTTASTRANASLLGSSSRGAPRGNESPGLLCIGVTEPRQPHLRPRNTRRLMSSVESDDTL